MSSPHNEQRQFASSVPPHKLHLAISSPPLFFEYSIFTGTKKVDLNISGLQNKKATEKGLEPLLTESESAVLPLHHSAIFRTVLLYQSQKKNQVFFSFSFKISSIIRFSIH